MASYKEYRTVNHPRTGEAYAVELDVLTGEDETDVIETVMTRVAGPLQHSDPTDPDSLEAYISNQGDVALEDAVWLQREFDREAVS